MTDPRKAAILGGLALGLVLALAAGPALAQFGATEAIINRFQKRYTEAKGLEAAYTAHSEPGFLAPKDAEPKTGRGLIYFVRPNKLRLIQEGPVVEELVVSPAGIWWYKEKTNEAHRFPASETYAEIAPLVGPIMDILGGGALYKSFNVERFVGGDTQDAEAIKLIPLSAASGLSQIVFLVDKEGYIVRIDLRFLSNDLVTYAFSDIKLLDEEPAIGFGFTPPLGAKIIHH